jgi:hypothetical protein
MANEFQLLPNPTNIPESAFTGYQRQNTNIFSLQTGLDTTEPYDNGTDITIPEGGIIEVNGSLFKLPSTVTITKPNANTAYWIAVSDNGDETADISLVTRPGVWNPAKKGSYTTTGARTLNWVSLGIPDNITETPVFSQAVKGTWEQNLQKGWYYANLRSGLGGGNGGNGGNASTGYAGSGGSGGVATSYDTVIIIFFFNGACSKTPK